MRGPIARRAALAVLAAGLTVTTALASTGCCALVGETMAERGEKEGTLSGEKSAQPTKPDMLPEHEAMDQMVQTVFEDVFGGAHITQAFGAADGVSMITLQYEVDRPPVEGDGERVLAELLTAGATRDPENPSLDYHYGSERMMVGVDLGNPTYTRMKVDVTPKSTRVSVSAVPDID